MFYFIYWYESCIVNFVLYLNATLNVYMTLQQNFPMGTIKAVSITSTPVFTCHEGSQKCVVVQCGLFWLASCHSFGKGRKMFCLHYRSLQVRSTPSPAATISLCRICTASHDTCHTTLQPIGLISPALLHHLMLFSKCGEVLPCLSYFSMI